MLLSAHLPCTAPRDCTVSKDLAGKTCRQGSLLRVPERVCPATPLATVQSLQAVLGKRPEEGSAAWGGPVRAHNREPTPVTGPALLQAVLYGCAGRPAPVSILSPSRARVNTQTTQSLRNVSTAYPHLRPYRGEPLRGRCARGLCRIHGNGARYGVPAAFHIYFPKI